MQMCLLRLLSLLSHGVSLIVLVFQRRSKCGSQDGFCLLPLLSIHCSDCLLHFFYLSFVINHSENPLFLSLIFLRSVTVAERSKAYTVFARSKAGVVGSDPTQGMDVSCLCVCFFYVYVQVQALRQADHPPTKSYRMSKI
jgi:hypothetical protein